MKLKEKNVRSKDVACVSLTKNLKRIALTSVVFTFVLCCSSNLFAQQNMRDVIHLKNGSVIKGMITEHIPNVSYKVETGDGSVMIYQATEVERIGRERADNIPNMRDVIYLKNGSIMRGTITEHISNVSYKIETGDGSVMVYAATDVARITKEPAPGTQRGGKTSKGATGTVEGQKRQPQPGDFALGLSFLYWSQQGSITGGKLSASYVISEEFRLAGSISGLSQNIGRGITERWADYGVNGHYLFPLFTGSIIYITAGVGITAVEFEDWYGDKISGSEMNINFGGGYNWMLSDHWFINLQTLIMTMLRLLRII